MKKLFASPLLALFIFYLPINLPAQTSDQVTVKKLIGSWHCSQYGYNLEFQEGGIAYWNGIEVNYTLVSSNRIQYYASNGFKDSYQVDLNGSTLIFKNYLGTFVYQRQSAGNSFDSNSSGGSDVIATQQLSQLLASSAWCSYSYSRTSGSTWSDHTENSQIKFFSNGTFSATSGGESYNSGPYGTLYSDQSDRSAGKWKTLSGKLLMNCKETGWLWLTVPFELNYNSNGYPIIKINGTEFSMCN